MTDHAPHADDRSTTLADGRATGRSPGPLPGRKFLREHAPAERVRGLFSISNAQLGKTRQDKPYLRCIIGDKSGEMPGRMWSVDEATFRRLPTDGFVYLEGETQPYQGEVQLIIHSIDAADPSPGEMRDLLPCAKRPVEEMWDDLTGVLGTLSHPAMKALVATYLADETLMAAFRQCPAAKSMHHAYLGGLLEHTLTLVRLADVACPLYPGINRDLVITGLFLHDLGKTRELVYDRAFAYTDRGELIGHIVEGAIMLHDKVQQMIRETGQRLPPGTLTVLQHIILSHHSLPEFGAAKIPSTPEAILVAQLDNLDAKVTMAMVAARPDGSPPLEAGGNFTERQWALDTKLFRPDPLSGS
ncbi:MAG: HD domain-containing protein [Phycisphaeraceae bacterium]|nr:HD domain-containing protein [Phycisphaerae bacterium]MBX3392031.1 HD domain-containing protein [Phycisphaeraceae bacterium]